MALQQLSFRHNRENRYQMPWNIIGCADIFSFVEFNWLKDPILTALNERKLALLKEGVEIADLSMINPDIPPPRLLMDKLLELTVRPANHRYAVARGIRRLREAFAYKYSDRFNVKLDPETEVCVTLGSKDGLEQVLRVLARPGRVLAAASPAYAHYRTAAKLNGYRFVTFPILFSRDANSENCMNESSMDAFLDGCAALPNGSVILLNFPHNPSGQLAPAGFYERLIPILLERDHFVINDFVYGELTYSGQPAQSLLANPALRSRAIELYSLSKTYSVPGWRIGAVLGAPEIVQTVSALKSHIDYGIFLPLQGAAAAALHAPSSLITPIIDEYARRAQTLCGALKSHGWNVITPVAGAAVWAALPEWAGGSVKLAHELLETARIGCTPGEIFFSTGYENSLVETASIAAQDPAAWIRFALVAPEGHLRLIADRIGAVHDSPDLLHR